MPFYNIFSRIERKQVRQIRSLQKRTNSAVTQRLNFADLTRHDMNIVSFVLNSSMTMVGGRALLATCAACKYATLNDVAGDFVECGVWRGGNAIAAKMIFDAYGSNKKVWLFDTFAGMTQPSESDFNIASRQPAINKFYATQRNTHNEWCYASLADVKNNFVIAGADLTNVRFVVGDVLQTLADQANLPQQIAVLRLDTDWYESSKIEMEVLYPLLSTNGVLLIDDYDNWAGQRKAIDEYFAQPEITKPNLHRVGANRVVIK